MKRYLLVVLLLALPSWSASLEEEQALATGAVNFQGSEGTYVVEVLRSQLSHPTCFFLDWAGDKAPEDKKIYLRGTVRLFGKLLISTR